MIRKVAIFGWWHFSLDNVREAARDGYALWGVNDPSRDFGPDQADRWYQLHSVEYLHEHWPYWESHTKPIWLEYWKMGHKTPLYMQKKYPDLPGSIEFPKVRIEQELPNGRYHCGSFDWMVAHAILDGIDAIRLYGINLMPPSEPFSSRPCLEYWLGVAAGRGLEVQVEESGDLFKTFNLVRTTWQYAFDESRPIIEINDVIHAEALRLNIP